MTTNSFDPTGATAQEILNALPDGAYITDLNRKVVFWNRAAERITGWTAPEIVGHACSENLLVHIDKDGHSLCGQEHCPLHRAMITGQESQTPLLVFAQHRQGHRIPVEVSVAPLRDPAGQILGGVEVFRDLTNLITDLNRAKAIQEHALESALEPDDRVRFDFRYQPEDLVGGDFYRFEQVTPDGYLILVADVMGHGVASALYTMQLRSIWEECRAALVSPALFISQLNERLHKLVGADGYFATAFCALLDVSSGQLDYVRAGHPAPFLFRSGGDVDRLDARCPAVGLMEEVMFSQTSVVMDRGDQLLFFTDGALEIVDSSGVLLGEDGLLRILQEEMPGLDLMRIESRLLQFSQAIRLPDDLTLVRVTLL